LSRDDEYLLFEKTARRRELFLFRQPFAALAASARQASHNPRDRLTVNRCEL